MNNNPPYFYEDLNIYNGALSPSTVHVKNTALARFFKRYLLQEAMSVFEWKMPESWDRAYFLYVLYVWGYIGIIRTDAFGVIPQHGTLGGRNVFYAPSKLLVSNPLFDQSYSLKIGEECTLLRLQPDYCGLYDVVDFYGDMMALTAETAGVNLINSRLSFVFAANNKAMAESFKDLYDQIAEGNPATFADKKLFDDDGKLKVAFLNQNVGESFILPQLLDCLQAIRCLFLTAVGIPNVNVMKQSGVSLSEVNANDFETKANCELWLDELKKGCELANAMYPGIDISVDWRKDLKGGTESDARRLIVDQRSF